MRILSRGLSSKALEVIGYDDDSILDMYIDYKKGADIERYFVMDESDERELKIQIGREFFVLMMKGNDNG
jgi:hypothetical protein